MNKFLFTSLIALSLVACSQTPDNNKNPIDGRAYHYDEALWAECTQDNKIMALKLEYDHYLNQVDTDTDSDEKPLVFKEHCTQIDDTVWCDKDSNASSIMSVLQDDISANLSRCCFQANGQYFKQLPEEKYLTFVTTTKEDSDESWWSINSEETIKTPVISQLQTDENDKKVIAYSRKFSPELFGSCMAK